MSARLRVAAAAALMPLALFVGACGGGATAADAPEVIYHNGKIVTANDAFEVVEAVAVRDGKLLAVGSDREVRALAGAKTQLVDLQGKTVLPGFNDSHVHFNFGTAPDKNRFDMRTVQNVAELQDALRNAAAEVPEGEWIIGRLSETSFPEAKLPTRKDLDAAAPGHPVALPRGPHIWIVNTIALGEAGITSATKQPSGGVIQMDAQGNPNGVLRERNAQRLVGRLLPPEPPALDDSTAEDNLRSFLHSLASLGITSGNVAGLLPGSDFRRVQRAYEKWGEELARMTLQLRVRPGYDLYDDLDVAVRKTISDVDGLSFHTGFGNDRLKIGGIKMSVDGGFTGQAAWMLEPYPDGRFGSTRIPRETLLKVARYVHDRGWQIGIHVIGDAGVQMTVDVLDQVMRESPRPDPRHFIHHMSMRPPEATLQTMVSAGILVSSQPNFTYDLAPYYTSCCKGARLASNNPQRSLMEKGIKMGYGSDHRPYGPIVAIWAAVTREGRDGKTYGAAEEAVSLKDAIRNHTYGSAYLTFDEKKKGTLEVGKFADMVVLTEDILTVDPKRIRDIGIEQTIIGGKVVYTATEPLVAKFDDGVVWKARPTSEAAQP